MCELCRRSFLGGMAAIGMAGALPTAFAQGTSDTRFERAAGVAAATWRIPHYQCHVITMDPQLGDIPNGSVHVKMARSWRSARMCRHRARR